MSNEEKPNKIKEIYEDGFMEINGSRYDIGKINHKTRLKIFAFSSKNMYDLQTGNFGFMGTDEWEKMESLILQNIIFNGSSLSKIGNHFDKDDYTGDYLLLIGTCLQVFSHPFMKGTK